MLLMFILEKEGRLLIFTAQCMNVIDYFAEQVSAMSLCLKEIDFQDKLKILMMLKIKWQIQPMSFHMERSMIKYLKCVHQKK